MTYDGPGGSVGQRANLLVVERPGSYELYYSHWRANALDQDLFWGPEVALASIRAHVSVAEGAEWLDERWCEGGAVLDLARRHLLWFGGEDVMYDVLLRRVLQGVMRERWPGWSIAWAAEGITDLARYVGEPVGPLLVLEKDRRRPKRVDLGEPGRGTIISARTPSGLGLRSTTLWDAAFAGEALVRALGRTVDRLPFAPDGPPLHGIHLDLVERTVGAWSALDLADAARRLRDAWPGWTTTFRGDRFEAQVEACAGRLELPPIAEEAHLSRVRDIVLRDVPDRSHVMSDVALAFAPQTVEVDPAALRDDPPDLAAVATAEAFDAAVAAWRARRE